MSEESADSAWEENWIWDWAERETAGVATRIHEHLEKWPLIHMLMRHFGSLLFGAAQKLIDKAVNTKDSSTQDEAIIMSCSRLFSECFAAYELIRKGMLLQSIVLLRSAFEIASQGILFLEHPRQAERWLGGKRIAPKEVRELTAMPMSQRNLYKKLSNLAHPNYEAFRYFSVPVPHSGGLGAAYIYGGWFAPKEAGEIAIQLLWAQLVFLEKFYAVYSDELDKHGMLWTEGARKRLKEGDDFNLTWEQFLGMWRKTLSKLTKDYEEKNPSDYPEIALAMSDYTSEQKDQWRRGWQAAEKQAKGQAEDLPSSD